MTCCLYLQSRKLLGKSVINSIVNFESSTKFPFVISESVLKMPVITAVVAHRRYHSKQSQTLMTKPPSATFKETTPPRSVNMWNNNNNNNYNPAILKSQNKFQCGQRLQQASFSTSAAKSFKSKVAEVFNFTFSLNRLISDHEESRRYYAKGQNKPTGKKSQVVVNEQEMAELIDVEAYKEKLERIMTYMKDDFTQQLSVRNAAGALDQILVEFEGEKYPLYELGQISRKNPQMAIVNLSSLPDACSAVLKAIRDSGMNLNPQQDGTTIFVPLPKMTREHRENLSRNAKSLFNKYKVEFQTVQNRFIKNVDNQAEGFSEDLVRRVKAQVMKLAQERILEAEKLTKAKQQEITQLD